MATYRINLNKVTDEIKTVYHTGWLISDKKGDNVILEVNSLNDHPAILKAKFITLCEGILNSTDKKKIEVNYNAIEIKDYKSMAVELSNLTGIQFSIELI